MNRLLRGERLVFRLPNTQLSPRSDQQVRTRCTYPSTLMGDTRSSTQQRSNQSLHVHGESERLGGPPRIP